MDEDTRISLFERCYKEGDDFRDKDVAIMNPFTGTEITKPWYYYDRIFRGFQWDDTFVKNMDAWASRPVKNMVFSGVLGYTTMITDNAPSISVVPVEERDKDLADTVDAAIKYWWKRQYMQQTLALAVMSSRIFGTGWLHLYHDPKKGEVCQAVHPQSILVDPDCTVEDFDPTYLIYESRMQVGELRDRFHDKPVDPNDDKSAKVDFKDFSVGWKVGAANRSERTDHARMSENYNPARSTPVYQFWVKDDSKIVWNDEDILPGKTVKKSKPKYPGGRRITIAGGLVLEDTKNPYRHKEFPFTPIPAYPVPGKFYSMGDVQNVVNPLVTRNRMSQFLVDQTLRSGGGKLFIGERAKVELENVSNAPYLQLIPCRDPQDMNYIASPAPSRHVFEHLAILDSEIADMLGLHDISQGKRTPGNPVTAQEAMILAESDRTRVRFSSRLLAQSIERVGRQLLSNLAQWSDFKWMLKIAGKDVEDEPRLVPFTGADLKTLSKENIAFDLEVADSSTLPASQQETYQKVERLMAMGVLTPEDVLKYKLVDIPHADEILADREAMMQAQAEAQAAAPPPEEAMMTPDMLAGVPPPPTEQLPPEALSPVPPDMSPEDILAAIEMMAAQQGVPPEEVMMALTGGAM